MANQKSPTCLLLTPELRFHSFGFAARDFYHDLDPEEARHWLYFDKFKMKIHSTSVRHKKISQVIYRLKCLRSSRPGLVRGVDIIVGCINYSFKKVEQLLLLILLLHYEISSSF